MTAQYAPDDCPLSSDDVELYEWRSAGRPSIGVLEAVADSTNRDPTSMGALVDSVDTDALDSLLDDSRPDAQLSVTFEYEGVVVTVTGDGFIQLRC